MSEKLRAIDIDCPNQWCGAKTGEPCSRNSRVVYMCQRRRGQAELRSTMRYGHNSGRLGAQ